MSMSTILEKQGAHYSRFTSPPTSINGLYNQQLRNKRLVRQSISAKVAWETWKSHWHTAHKFWHPWQEATIGVHTRLQILLAQDSNRQTAKLVFLVDPRCWQLSEMTQTILPHWQIICHFCAVPLFIMLFAPNCIPSLFTKMEFSSQSP